MTNDRMELLAEMQFDNAPGMTKINHQANSSYLTEDTELVSFSEEGDENDEVELYTGAIRIDDFLYRDEKDSLSEATLRMSFVDDIEDELLLGMPQGIPREILVIDEDTPWRSNQGTDVHQRLLTTEMLARSYKAKLHSTEDSLDNLHECLKQAQTFAEDVLADRNQLLKLIGEMQEEDRLRLDRHMLLKVIMASSLCYYMCGGSLIVLTCSVFLNLLSDTVNTLL